MNRILSIILYLLLLRQTKAIQASVNMKNTSTMVQVDFQTCEVGVQVQDLVLADDRSRIDGDDVREVNEDLRETSETSKEAERATKANGKASKGVIAEENRKDTDKRMNAETKEKTAKVETDNAPFQYSITPRRLQKLEENNPSPKKHSSSTQNEVTCSNEDGKTSKQQTEVVPEENPRLVQGTSLNAVNKDGFLVRRSPERSIENEKAGSEEQKSALIEEDRASIELHEAGIQLQDEQELLAVSERMDADKDVQSHELPGVKHVNEETRKNGEKESIRKRKAKQTKSAEEEIQEDEDNIQENSANKTNKSQDRRVLRSRAKGCHSEVKLDTMKGEKRKEHGSKTRQKIQDSVVETAVMEKCKPDGWDLRGHELTMFDKSTPETDQLPRETDMSSREIDPVVDQPRPSREVTIRAPASDETSQQPEPEVLGRLNEGNLSSQSECLRDYESDQGRLVLNVNRISTLEETNCDNCLYKDLEEGKSPCENGFYSDQQHNTNIASSGQQFQVVDDDSASKKQGSDSIEADYHKHLTRQTTKSKSRDTGRSKRDGQDPAEVSLLTAPSSKENSPQYRKLKSRKKR